MEEGAIGLGFLNLESATGNTDGFCGMVELAVSCQLTGAASGGVVFGVSNFSWSGESSSDCSAGALTGSAMSGISISPSALSISVPPYSS